MVDAFVHHNFESPWPHLAAQLWLQLCWRFIVRLSIVSWWAAARC